MRLTEVISLVRARRRDGQDENTCLSMSDKRSSENNLIINISAGQPWIWRRRLAAHNETARRVARSRPSPTPRARAKTQRRATRGRETPTRSGLGVPTIRGTRSTAPEKRGCQNDVGRRRRDARDRAADPARRRARARARGGVARRRAPALGRPPRRTVARLHDPRGLGAPIPRRQARSISHWSPYDPVGVVNADP